MTEIAPHWRLRRERYALQGEICPHCGAKVFPPRAVCPQCGGVESLAFQFLLTDQDSQLQLVSIVLSTTALQEV